MLFFISQAPAQVKKIVATQSTITYFLTHPLHEIEAVSKSAYSDVYLDAAAKQIKHVFTKVDVKTFDSGNSNRDSHAMEVIDALTYPDARFTSTDVTNYGDSVRVTGKMTFHGVTNDLSFVCKCKWEQDKLTVNGGFDLSLTQYKVERPSLLMIPVNDDLRFTVLEVFPLKSDTL
jgi:polyisoprenoid-binding protein YceI